MPLRIRWKSKDYIGIALMLLGACGLFQAIFILLGQVYLGVNSYFVMILIPIAIVFALFYGTIIIFESYAQVRRREKLRSQFHKKGEKPVFKKFFSFPITKPLLIIFSVFVGFFFLFYFILNAFIDEFSLPFVIAENVAAVACLVIANAIERYIG
jgi:hypothetical protein